MEIICPLVAKKYTNYNNSVSLVVNLLNKHAKHANQTNANVAPMSTGCANSQTFSKISLYSDNMSMLSCQLVLLPSSGKNIRMQL